MPPFARKGQKVLMSAVPATHPRKPVAQVAAVQVAIDHMADVGPEKPIPALKALCIDLLEDLKMILHALVVRGIWKNTPSDRARTISKANVGWKCTSISCTPAKYQGALVGLELRPGLAGAPNGALKSSDTVNTKAAALSATAASRIRRLGLLGTMSGFSSGSCPGDPGTTRPPALRTRQKW